LRRRNRQPVYRCKKKVSIKIKVMFFVIPICLIACFSLLVYSISREKLKEKFIDTQNYLELLSLYSYSYKDRAIFVDTMLEGMRYIDSLPHVFAALYNDSFEILSYRSPEEGTAPFDPRLDNSFMALAGNNTTGTIPIIWEDLPGGITKRKMYVCFRWATIPEYNRSYLMAAAVSSYSLASPTINLFVGIVSVILLAALFLSLGFVIKIVRGLYLQLRGIK